LRIVARSLACAWLLGPIDATAQDATPATGPMPAWLDVAGDYRSRVEGSTARASMPRTTMATC
jgi:hypothetical protein